MTRWGTYYSKTYKGWIQAAVQSVEQYSGEPVDMPVMASVLFAIPRAATSKLIVPVGDGDNYEKAVFDMIQKRGYLADDKWITTGHWKKRFLPHGTVGYTEITLTKETESIDLVMKTCTKCNLAKPLEEFPRDCTVKSGILLEVETLW